jgi:hypothetical protein
MNAGSPQKFLRLYLGMTIGSLLAIALFNFIVDPLWVYHSPWLRQAYAKDARQANAGQARFGRYDSVVIGNSHTENFLVSEIQSQLGWHPLKLCISGSTAREQHLVLDQALATGQVRDVLWSIDFSVFERGPDATRTSDFPHHLYNRDAATPFKYLLSGSTLGTSFEVLFGGGSRDQESRFVWHHLRKYGPGSVAKALPDAIAGLNSRPTDNRQAYIAAQSHLLDVIRSHPEVRFHIVLPPFPALWRAIQMGCEGNHFESQIQFKQDLSHALIALPNAQLFDFELATSVTHDLNRYTDLGHFDLRTSNQLLAWIAEGRFRVQPHEIEENARILVAETRDYVGTVLSSDNSNLASVPIKSAMAKMPTLAQFSPSTANPPARMADSNTDPASAWR